MIREINDVTFILDSEKRIIWADSSFDRYFSIDGKSAAGSHIELVLPDFNIDCPTGAVFSHDDDSGQKHYFEAKCDTALDDLGGFLSTTVTLKDVTLLQTLLNISILTITTKGPNDLLEKAIVEIADTFGYRTIAALLTKDNTLELAASQGYSDMLTSLLSRQKISPDERGMAGRSAFHRKTIVREIKAGAVSSKLMEESRRLGIRWATTVPIGDKDGLLGVLAISTSEQPTTAEIGLLQIICNQICLSLRKILNEEELNNARNELELYVDLMCHDISNALQIALGYLEILHHDLRATKRDYTLCSMNALSKIGIMISNVRNIRRSRTICIEAVGLKNAVEAAINEVYCAASIIGKDIKIDSDIDPGIKINASALLKDLLFNVLDHTLRRINDHGWINIYTVIKNDQCDLLIEDSGPGIIHKESIFRVPGHVAEEKFGGISIGLYLAKSIMDRCGGKIVIEDRSSGETEKGSRFRLIFTVARME